MFTELVIYNIIGFVGLFIFISVCVYFLTRLELYYAIRRRLIISGAISTSAACFLLTAVAYSQHSILINLFWLSSLIACAAFGVIIFVESYESFTEFVQTMREKQTQKYLEKQKRNNPQN